MVAHLKTLHGKSDKTQDIVVEQRDALNVLRFSRPDKKNAITGSMYDSLTAALRAGEADSSIKVHVFLGLPGAFTAGNDISDFIASAAEQGGLGREVLGFLHCLTDCEKPLVAGVDGMAVGIGTTLLMHCDLVYASPKALFVTPFTALGLVPEAASSLLGPRLMGHQRAFALLALGEKFDAAGALAAGLVNAVVDPDELESRVLEVATNLAAKPTDALRATRRLLRGDAAELKQRIDDEAVHFARLLKSEDAQKAFATFLSKKQAGQAKPTR